MKMSCGKRCFFLVGDLLFAFCLFVAVVVGSVECTYRPLSTGVSQGEVREDPDML